MDTLCGATENLFFCQNHSSNSYINRRADLKLSAAPLLCQGDLEAEQSLISSVCYFLLDKMVRALHYRRESIEEKVKVIEVAKEIGTLCDQQIYLLILFNKNCYF